VEKVVILSRKPFRTNPPGGLFLLFLLFHTGEIVSRTFKRVQQFKKVRKEDEFFPGKKKEQKKEKRKFKEKVYEYD
jgi:hypothetical protein